MSLRAGAKLGMTLSDHHEGDKLCVDVIDAAGVVAESRRTSGARQGGGRLLPWCRRTYQSDTEGLTRLQTP